MVRYQRLTTDDSPLTYKSLSGLTAFLQAGDISCNLARVFVKILSPF
ncbi:MAG: hypothetical protein WAT20_15320 [Ferruginibacter sp.]